MEIAMVHRGNGKDKNAEFQFQITLISSQVFGRLSRFTHNKHI